MEVSTQIAPGDLMWEMDSPEAYFQHGENAVVQIERAVEASGARVRKMLDFPCGHGRVLRWLEKRFDARVVACDLDRSAVDFCAETFGAEPVYSDEDPARIELPGKFDLIWSGSLLTHLRDWQGFMELFMRHLRPRGLLVFTTAGRNCAERMRSGTLYSLTADRAGALLRSYDEVGFGYADYSDQPRYGIACANPAWVFGFLSGLPLRVVYFSEQGWSGEQDVWGAVRLG